jgi:glycine cleavage system H protein
LFFDTKRDGSDSNSTFQDHNPEIKMNILISNAKMTNGAEGNMGTIGITDHAQEQLSDIVFVEIVLSEGETASQGDTCAAVESVKAAADVYLPVMEVVAINDALPDAPKRSTAIPTRSSMVK